MSTDGLWVNQLPWLPTAQGGPNGGGGSLSDAEAIQFRDPLDAARSGALGRGRIGQADYPDGYLGPVNDRRQDRLANEVAGRLTDRSYQRGVHAGVKMNRIQYFWPEEFTPSSGIEREMRGVQVGNVIMVEKATPVGSPVEHLVNGGKFNQMNAKAQADAAQRYGVNPAAIARPGELVDPARSAYLSRDLPTTSW